MSNTEAPKGVVGLFISPNGNVRLQAACFDKGASGPFCSDRSRQRYACEQRLYKEFAEEWLYPFKDCVSISDIEGIVRSATRVGWKTIFIPIGYEEEE